MKRRAICMVAALGVLAGCSSTAGSQQPSMTPVVERSRRHATSPSHIGDLFVAFDDANGGGVSVFPVGAQTPDNTIRSGVHHPRAVVADRFGDIFVANPNDVAVYTSKHDEGPDRMITVGAENPQSLAVDSEGRLYVGNDSEVDIYERGKSIPKFVLPNFHNLGVVAVDAKGTLYVGDLFGVTAFDPASGEQVRRFGDAVNVHSVAIDPQERVYATSQALGNLLWEAVNIYRRESDKMWITVWVEKGDAADLQVAVDSADHLYVRIAKTQLRPGRVEVYTSIGKYPLIIKDGASNPGAMVVDQFNNLYLADFNENSVHIYTAASETPLTTLRVGGKPIALAIGP